MTITTKVPDQLLRTVPNWNRLTDWCKEHVREFFVDDVLDALVGMNPTDLTALRAIMARPLANGEELTKGVWVRGSVLSRVEGMLLRARDQQASWEVVLPRARALITFVAAFPAVRAAAMVQYLAGSIGVQNDWAPQRMDLSPIQEAALYAAFAGNWSVLARIFEKCERRDGSSKGRLSRAAMLPNQAEHPLGLLFVSTLTEAAARGMTEGAAFRPPHLDVVKLFFGVGHEPVPIPNGHELASLVF